MVMYDDVVYDSKGFPHKRSRQGKIVKGKLKPGKATTPLPAGWTWKKKKRRKK